MIEEEQNGDDKTRDDGSKYPGEWQMPKLNKED